MENKNVLLYLLIGLAVGLLVFSMATTHLYTCGSNWVGFG